MHAIAERTKFMIETLAVFQLARFWLKAFANSNIYAQSHESRPSTTTKGTV
jgi:hypothetical protein